MYIYNQHHHRCRHHHQYRHLGNRRYPTPPPPPPPPTMKKGTSFVSNIRSRRTLRDRPAVVCRISLKLCFKTVGPRWCHRRREFSGYTRDGNPSTTSHE
jgi:hypothetical protein